MSVLRKYKSNTSLFYILVTLITLAFINFDGATSFLPMVVPHIDGHVVPLHFVLLIISFILFVIEKLATDRILTVDTVTRCLFIKCVLDAIPIIRGEVDTSIYFWYYAITIASFISYLIISNSVFDEVRIKKLRIGFYLFASVLSLQVMYTAFNTVYPWTSIYFKSAMVIPYGGTNIIASIIVPIICMFYIEGKSKFKWIFIGFLSIAVFLTKSRGGVLLELILVCVLVYRRLGERKNRILSRFFLILAIIIFIIAMLQVDDVQVLLQGYSSVSTSTGIDSIFSGRLSTWREAFDNFINGGHTFFGIGMQTRTGYISGAHNIVIDLLLKGGIIGTINYFVAIKSLYKKRKFAEDNSYRAWLVMSITIMVNSLFEVCYFSYACDVMFWIINGIYAAESKKSTKTEGVNGTVSTFYSYTYKE